MSPTPEQITAMDARGWTWHPPGDMHPVGMFVVAGMVGADQIFELAICPGTAPGEWIGEFTTARLGRIATPGDLPTVADRVEGYLRAVLSPLRFPWLSVSAAPKPAPARAPRTCWTCRWANGTNCDIDPQADVNSEVGDWAADNIDWVVKMPLPTATPCPGHQDKP